MGAKHSKNVLVLISDLLLIEPKKLYDLMSERATTFLVLDVRPASDYKACKIDIHAMSINIPEDIIEPGCTCKHIERKIHIEYRSTWNTRATRDMLILMDWTSNDISESFALSGLKDAIQKWDDPSVKYKCEKKLHLLKGGLENFVLHYPTLVVNPDKARNPPARYVEGKNKGKSKGLEELASTIAYPELDAAFIATPSPAKDHGIAATETPAAKYKFNPSSAIEITSAVNINRYCFLYKVLVSPLL